MQGTAGAGRLAVTREAIFVFGELALASQPTQGGRWAMFVLSLIDFRARMGMLG
jgi:hypothetical protein